MWDPIRFYYFERKSVTLESQNTTPDWSKWGCLYTWVVVGGVACSNSRLVQFSQGQTRVNRADQIVMQRPDNEYC